MLVAPSWGPDAILESLGTDLVKLLLAADFEVIVRPHPLTGTLRPQVLGALREMQGVNGYRLDLDIASHDSLEAADIMISDWSGAALEFAFGLDRPVVFVDVPPKINNPEYDRIQIAPMEQSIRTQIGEVVPADALDDIVPHIRRLCAEPGKTRRRIAEAREQYVYNIGESAAVAAREIAGLADQTTA